MAYIRCQVRYSGKTGKPVGIFGTCCHLWRRGLLSDEEAARIEEVENRFEEVLPEPPSYADGNSETAITSFRLEKTKEMRRRDLPALLRAARGLVRGEVS